MTEEINIGRLMHARLKRKLGARYLEEQRERAAAGGRAGKGRRKPRRKAPKKVSKVC